MDVAVTDQDWKVGDTLYLVPTYRAGRAETLPITKIGRKWLTVGKDYHTVRVDKQTLAVEGGGYATKYVAYRSQWDYLDQMARREYWVKFWRGISGSTPPAHLTMEDIVRIARECGVDVEAAP